MFIFTVVIGSVAVMAVPAFAENSVKKSVSIDDPDIEVSEVLTFEEVVNEFTKDNGVSISEARMQFLSAKGYAATYRTLTSRFTVTSSYRPALKYYVETSEGGGFWGIIEVKNVSMDRSWNGLSKVFSGNVYTHLQNANQIYYQVDGDFYNNGTTTTSVELGLKIGEFANATFSASNTSNHYQYIWTEGYYR